MFFLASARSCCRWLGQRCSVRRPCLPEDATSILRAPWAARTGQRGEFGLGGTIEDAPPGRGRRSLRGQHRLDPFFDQIADALARQSRGRCLAPQRSGCRSILPLPHRHRPSTRSAPWSTSAPGACHSGSECSRRSRSSALSFTTYFFTAISFTVTNRLRRYVRQPSIRTSYALSMTWPTSSSAAPTWTATSAPSCRGRRSRHQRRARGKPRRNAIRQAASMSLEDRAGPRDDMDRPLPISDSLRESRPPAQHDNYSGRAKLSSCPSGSAM